MHEREVFVTGEIRLGQLLKLAGLVESGAQARTAIVNGYVRVDGQVNTRRGSRLTAGQIVTVDYGDEVESVVIRSKPDDL